MRNTITRLLTLLAISFVGIQFFHPKGNNSKDETNYIGKKFPVPDSVQAILKVACNDCHSNNTHYPWYSKIQPVDWWLNNHIVDGKRHFNFSEFSVYPLKKQYRKIQEVIEQVDSSEMPLESYTIIHKDAILDARQKEQVMAWARSIKDSMELHYPVDSLKSPKR